MSLLTYRNLFLTMLLGGIWHGAAWTFVIWGLIHGTSLIAERMVMSFKTLSVPGPAMAVAGHGSGSFAPIEPGKKSSPLARAFGVLITFHIVCLAWIFFRSENLEYALSFVRGLADWSQPGQFTSPFLVMLVAASLGAHFLPKNLVTTTARALEGVGPIGFGFLLGFGILLIETLAPEGVAPFIYFQF